MLFNKIELPQISADHADRSAPRIRGRLGQTRKIENRLMAAIMDLCERQAEVLHHKETAWASITFSGKRHEICLRFAGSVAVAAGETLIAALPDHEFTIAGKIVADATVTETDHRLTPDETLEVTLEILLLDDA